MVFRHKKVDRDNYPGPGAYERYGDFYKYGSPLTSIYKNNNNSRKDKYKSPEKKRNEDESLK